MGVGRRHSGFAGSAKDRGATLVEFAILSPLIFALIFGMLTGGLSLSRKNSMENAVREASRLGATLPDDTSWAAAVQGRALQLSSGDLEMNQICVELVRKTAPAGTEGETTRRASSCSFPSIEPSTKEIPAGDCVVKVWAQRTSRFNFIVAGRDLTLTTDAISRYERAGDPPTCGQ